MNPSPYFSNVLEIGDLTLDYVFAEQDCPIIFTCKDKNDKLYFCVCITMTNIQKWVLTKVSFNRLKDYINNRISSYDMFKNSENKLFVLSWNYGYSKENCKIITSEKVTDDDLPQKNAFLDAYDDEFNDYIEIVSNRLLMNKELSFIKRMCCFDQSNSINIKPPLFNVAFDENIVQKTLISDTNPVYKTNIFFDTKPTISTITDSINIVTYIAQPQQEYKENKYLKAS